MIDEFVYQLTNRMNELEEENARLKADLIHNDACAVCAHGQADSDNSSCDCECELCKKSVRATAAKITATLYGEGKENETAYSNSSETCWRGVLC